MNNAQNVNGSTSGGGGGMGMLASVLKAAKEQKSKEADELKKKYSEANEEDNLDKRLEMNL
jgi:hypothetical protein